MAQVTLTCVKLNKLAIALPGAIIPPKNVTTRVRTPPMIDASTTCPGRILYIHNPTSSAIGIVQAMVNVPQCDPGTSRTDPAGIGADISSPLTTGISFFGDLKTNESVKVIDD